MRDRLFFKNIETLISFSISNVLPSTFPGGPQRCWNALLWLPQGTWQCEEPKYLDITTRDPIRSCGTLKGWCCYWGSKLESVSRREPVFLAQKDLSRHEIFVIRSFYHDFLATSNDFQQMNFPFNQGLCATHVFRPNSTWKATEAFITKYQSFPTSIALPEDIETPWCLLNFESCVTCHL